MDAGRSNVQGHLLVHRKLKVNLSYIKPCLRTKQRLTKSKLPLIFFILGIRVRSNFDAKPLDLYEENFYKL